MAAIKASLDAGRKLPVIATENGWSLSSVRKAARRIELRGNTVRKAGPGRKYKNSQDAIEQAWELNPQQSAAELAQAAKVPKTAARRLMRNKIGTKPLKALPTSRTDDRQRLERLTKVPK